MWTRLGTGLATDAPESHVCPYTNRRIACHDLPVRICLLRSCCFLCIVGIVVENR